MGSGRPPDPARARQMAEFFLHGPPGLRGDWDRCAREAGFHAKIPKRSNVHLVALIRSMGGSIDAGEVQNFVDKATSQATRLDIALSAIPEAGSEGEAAAWEKLAKQLLEIWRDIATGEEIATPAQRDAVKDLLNRAERFRDAKKAEEKSAVQLGVVVLPMLGPPLQVCPQCGHKAGS